MLWYHTYSILFFHRVQYLDKTTIQTGSGQETAIGGELRACDGDNGRFGVDLNITNGIAVVHILRMTWFPKSHITASSKQSRGIRQPTQCVDGSVNRKDISTDPLVGNQRHKQPTYFDGMKGRLSHLEGLRRIDQDDSFGGDGKDSIVGLVGSDVFAPCNRFDHGRMKRVTDDLMDGEGGVLGIRDLRFLGGSENADDIVLATKEIFGSTEKNRVIQVVLCGIREDRGDERYFKRSCGCILFHCSPFE